MDMVGTERWWGRLCEGEWEVGPGVLWSLRDFESESRGVWMIPTRLMNNLSFPKELLIYLTYFFTPCPLLLDIQSIYIYVRAPRGLKCSTFYISKMSGPKVCRKVALSTNLLPWPTYLPVLEYDSILNSLQTR